MFSACNDISLSNFAILLFLCALSGYMQIFITFFDFPFLIFFQWHHLVHDFSRELKTLAVETIVNLMVDSQMQTLLNEFQYKSVSSLYKMLRQRMMGTLRSFEEHYRICRYELMLGIQDPRVLASADNMLARLQSQYCSAQEFLNIDALIKGDDYFVTHDNQVI